MIEANARSYLEGKRVCPYCDTKDVPVHDSTEYEDTETIFFRKLCLACRNTWLDLYDFVQPNDADVAACLMYCHKVEILEKSGMLELKNMELKTSPSEMARVLRPRKKKAKPKPIQEESISWEDDEDSD